MESAATNEVHATTRRSPVQAAPTVVSRLVPLKPKLERPEWLTSPDRLERSQATPFEPTFDEGVEVELSNKNYQVT
jgi:hypothetical protein